MKSHGVRLFRKWDILVLLLFVLALALSLLLWQRDASTPASLVVFVDGQRLEELPLPSERTEKAYLVDGKEIVLCLYPDGVEILSSPCPQQTCIKSGKITQKGSSIHCLPLRFGVLLQGKGELDGVTG